MEVGIVLNDRATDIDLKVASAGWLRLTRDLLVDLLRRLGQARSVLVAGQVGVVEGHLATGDHRDVHALVLAKPVKDLLEGHRALLQHDLVIVGEALRKHRDWAAHDWVKVLRLVLDNIIRLAHHDGGQSQVHESILKLLDLVEALGILIDLVADDTSDHSCSRGNSGNDLSSNHLCLIAVALCDLVVTGTKI